MYKASSKDINRNKSFHPLNAKNLFKIEKAQRLEAERVEQRHERAQELLRDEEERRYDTLALDSSSPFAAIAQGNGQRGAVAYYRQVRKVFAAEYEREAKEKQPPAQRKRLEEGGEPAETLTPEEREGSVLPGLVAAPYGNIMDKFVKATGTGTASAELASAAFATLKSEGVGGSKQSADANLEGSRGTNSHTGSANNARDVVGAGASPRAAGFQTGLVSSSEVVKLRKEQALLEKQRADPLSRVFAYQNRTIAEAARLKDRLERFSSQETDEDRGSRSGNYSTSSAPMERDAIEERIRKILNMTKGDKK